MVDTEARGDVLVNHWVLTLSLRYGLSVGPDIDDVSYDEIVLGVGVGRRIRLGRSVLDIGIMPALATMNLQWNQDQDDKNPQSGSSSTLRLGLSARWSTPIDAFWRFTITSDADVSLSGLEHATHLGLEAPPLPVWTAGLRFGASGALL